MKKELIINQTEVEVTIKGNGCFEFDNREYNYQVTHQTEHYIFIKLNGLNWKIPRYRNEAGQIQLVTTGRDISIGSKQMVRVESEDEAASMVSPMPGKILKVLVTVGQSVTAGDSLVVMEAMKMEHTIKSNYAGTVAEIFYQEGEMVQGGVELVVVDADEESK